MVGIYCNILLRYNYFRMSNRKLFKIAGYVGIITILSKIIGLIRDLVIANIYGTSFVADAYNFAYLLTGNALILLGGLGGPFHSATIATLTKLKINPKEAGSFILKILITTFLILLFLTIFILIFNSPIVQMIAPGHDLDPTYRLKLWDEIRNQLIIMSPLIVISGILGIACGIENVFGGYFFPSFGPAIASAGIIATIYMFGGIKSGFALALGTTIGAILQLFIQTPNIIRSFVKKELIACFIKTENTTKEYYFFLGPALLSTTIGQLTVYIDGFFCSNLEEGSWTATMFANRLIQLPLGVLLTSFLVPFFPKFSELANEKNIEKLKETALVVIKFLWFLIFPITAYLFLFSDLIVEIIFQRGAFDARSTSLTSGVLLALIFSMIAYIARDTLTRVFYSLGNSKIPLLIAIISIILKILLNSLLVGKYHAAGIALGTTIVTFINFIILDLLLTRKIGKIGWENHIKSILKMICISLIVYGLGFLSLNIIDLNSLSFINKIISLSIISILFFSTYFILAVLFKLSEANKIFDEVKSRI